MIFHILVINNANKIEIYGIVYKIEKCSQRQFINCLSLKMVVRA